MKYLVIALLLGLSSAYTNIEDEGSVECCNDDEFPLCETDPLSMDVSYAYNPFYNHLGDPSYNWEMRITLQSGKSC